ncbi:MAG: ATP-binding cassette domain-containing protein, partial [Cytophagales bacterium]
MNIISAQNISKAFSERFLFKNISFGLNQGDKVALVGTNGTGKSTLLKTIAGFYESDSGEVKIRKGMRIGYLSQDPDLSAFQKIKDAIYSESNTTYKLVKQYENAISDPDCDGDLMQDLLQEMENREAWDYDQKAEEILGKLGIYDTEVEITSLSPTQPNGSIWVATWSGGTRRSTD